jgi:hypothetical protein
VDNATNRNHQNRSSTNLSFDFTPPSKPENLAVIPADWASRDDFIVSWTNPVDLSGINGVFYKFDLKPNSNEDGVYTQGFNISNITIDDTLDGIRNLYIWLNDSAGNIDSDNYELILIRRDTAAPQKPENLLVTPGAWTNKNNFSVNWDNPSDFSGIYGAYYKLDTPPSSNDDGVLTTAQIPTGTIEEVGNITVSGNGAHKIYIWLIDRVGNIDFNNYAETELRFDDIKPGAPKALAIDPPYWTNSNYFTLSWENPQEMSGIGGAYYSIGNAPISKDDGIFVAGDDINMIKGINASSSGIWDVYLWLVDGAGNYDHMANDSVKLFFDDKTPSILHSKVEIATRNLPIALSAVIDDEHSSVKAAYIFYRAKSDPIYYHVAMSHKGNIYEGQIPAQWVYEDWMSYYIMALDHSDPPNVIYYGDAGETGTNLTTASDIDILVTDDDLAPPSITHEKVTTWPVGRSLTISAMVTDGASGISEVMLYYKKTDEVDYKSKTMLKSYSHYTATIEDTMVTAEGISYYISAADNSPKKNIGYFGRDGQVTAEPDINSDIDVVVTSTDKTAPKITGPDVNNITESSAVIFWLTDEPADGRVEWGFSEIYMDIVHDKVFSTVHSIQLTDLDSGTLYFFRVSSIDETGNGPTYSQGSSFTTLQPGKIDTDSDGIIDEIDIDDDNDGIEDAWEIKYNFDPLDETDAEQDVDLDGYSNLVEFYSDTDPRDPTSSPSSAADLKPPKIVHEHTARSIKGDPISISAIVTDSESGVKEVYLFYRVKGAPDYSRLDMGESSPYQASIPGDITAGAEVIEYYIMASDFGDNVIYYGSTGETDSVPNSGSDLDVILKLRLSEDEGNILERIGEPFGIESAGICVMLILIIIIVLIGIGFIISRASRKREADEELREEEEHKRRIEERRRVDDRRRREMYRHETRPPPAPARRREYPPPAAPPPQSVIVEKPIAESREPAEDSETEGSEASEEEVEALEDEPDDGIEEESDDEEMTEDIPDEDESEDEADIDEEEDDGAEDGEIVDFSDDELADIDYESVSDQESDFSAKDDDDDDIDKLFED